MYLKIWQRVFTKDGDDVSNDIIAAAYDVALKNKDEPFRTKYFAQKYLEEKGYIVIEGTPDEVFKLQEKLKLSSDLERQEK